MPAIRHEAPSYNADRQRRWRARNPEKVKRWAREGSFRQRLKKLGLTAAEYTAAVTAQDNKCAGCGEVTTHKLGLMLGHDHITGKFRALLCGHCNTVIGHAKDNSNVLRKLADYLEGHHV